MPAYAIGSRYCTVKILSVNYSNPDKGLPLIHGVVQVFDAENGEHIANLDGASVTAIRTGAASGLAEPVAAAHARLLEGRAAPALASHAAQ